jgi:alkyldihydroxyacetonephosphate synthase
VETLETATSWSNLAALREAVRAALPGLLVGCHVSHLYPTGASLYFTVLGRRSDDPAAQWRALKAAACDAIVAAGGTITHHHAVGRDHAPWMAAEVGEIGVGVLRAMKDRCDPAGIMNPGKLL